MCDPVSIGIMSAAGAGAGGASLGTALMVGSTAMGAVGQYQQGQYQAKVARNNAIVQRQMATDARRRGEIAESEHRMKVAQMKSRQRAAFSAAGVDPTTGSAARVQEDTSMFGELDALRIRSGAEREAFGFEQQATQYQAESELASMAGTQDAIGTILTGSGRVADKWYTPKSKGAR